MEILSLERNVSMTIKDAFDRFIRVKKANNLSPVLYGRRIYGAVFH